MSEITDEGGNVEHALKLRMIEVLPLAVREDSERDHFEKEYRELAQALRALLDGKIRERRVAVLDYPTDSGESFWREIGVSPPDTDEYVVHIATES